MASRAFRKGPPANVKALHIIIGGANVDGPSILVPPNPKRKVQLLTVHRSCRKLMCGASKISDEYYMATKLFVEPSNCSFFYATKTNAGRLHWLKRHLEERK